MCENNQKEWEKKMYNLIIEISKFSLHSFIVLFIVFMIIPMCLRLL